MQAKNRMLRWLIAPVAATVAFAASAQTPGPGQPTGQAARPPSAASTTTPAAQTSTPATMPTGMAPGSAKSVALSAADKKFMHDAAKGGMAEVQLGELAAQKASDADVKQFAEKMVTDHSKANDRLKQIASQKGVVLPTDLPSDAKREADKLSKLNGAAFDREYVKHMVADHKKDVGEFRAATKQARDPDVNQFAKDTLPVIEAHFQMVQGLSSRTK